MPLAIRLGDTSSHGGTVITACARTRIAGQLAARMGDLHDCPIPEHNVTPIIQGSPTVRIEGAAAARQGDTVGCGAALIALQGTVFIG